MDFNLRERLNDEMKKIVEKPEFQEIYHLLNEGNYTIEMSYEISYSMDDLEYEDTISFGYIYNNSYFDNRNDHMLRKNQFHGRPILPTSEIAKDIAKISKKLDFLYSFSIFDNLQNIIAEYRRYLEDKIGNLKNSDDYYGVSTYIEFTVNQIKVLGIDYEEHDPDIDGGLRDINLIKSLLPFELSVTNIAEQVWFKNLNKDSQALIKAGNQYIQKFLSEEKKYEILDYSPLLLDFIKALETEIKFHFQHYRSEILRVVEEIQKVYQTNGKKPQKEQIRKLLNQIKNIKSDNFKPNGLTSIYYLFKYFALGEDLNEIKSFKGYLPTNKMNIIVKEHKLLGRLKQLGLDRNVYIHEKYIDSEYEFIMYYDDLKLALKLLTTLV